MTAQFASDNLLHMARWNAFTYPLDVPAVEAPGLTHRESGFHGNAKYGFYVEPEHPIRRAKGDIGMSDLRGFETKPLSNGGPFGPLKRGR